MKRLLLILILTLSFQALTKADDISDFEIEEMSIRDSLLDYYSEDYLDSFTKNYYPKNKKFYYISGIEDDLENYEYLQFHLKNNDKKYIIYSVEGMIEYEENIKDAKLLITNYLNKKIPYLLLAEKNRSFGIFKSQGDFILKKNKILRFSKGEHIFFYSGLQMIPLDILKKFSKKSFSFNDVWDNLIANENLYGQIMKSNWYHVGDIKGLTIVKKLDY